MIEATERRARVAGDESSGFKSGAPVELLLHEQKTNNSLRPRDEDPLFGQVIFVGEGRGFKVLDEVERAFPPRSPSLVSPAGREPSRKSLGRPA